METKNMHLHIRLEPAYEDEAGLSVGQVWKAGVEVEETLDVGVDVAGLPEIGQVDAEMRCVTAVCMVEFHWAATCEAPSWRMASVQVRHSCAESCLAS